MGFLSVATYRAALYNLFQGAVWGCQQKQDYAEKGEQELKDLLTDALSLAYWFYVSGKSAPLPGLYESLGRAHLEQTQAGLSAAVTFVVMHEVGHIRLGHVDEGASGPSQVCGPLPYEAANRRKRMELEADTFAVESFKKEVVAGTVGNGATLLFDLASDLELVCLPRSGSHPLAVNRIENLIAHPSITQDSFYRGRLENLLHMRLLLLRERMRAVPDDANYPATINTRAILDNFTSQLPSQERGMRAVETLKTLYRSELP